MAFLIHIKKGTGLRNADGMFGTSDPYCQIQVEGGSSWKTSIIEDNLNPLWDQVYLVIPTVTAAEPTIKFTVFDSDKGVVVDGSDDFLGEHECKASLDALAGWEYTTATLTGDKATGTIEYAIKAYAPFTVQIHAAKGLRNADGCVLHLLCANMTEVDCPRPCSPNPD